MWLEKYIILTKETRLARMDQTNNEANESNREWETSVTKL